MEYAYAYLLICDMPGDPADVTSRVGLAPTRVERKGESPHRVVLKNNRWILESPTSRDDCDLDHHIRDLLTLMEPKKKEIRAVVDQCFGRFTLVGSFHHANDGFILSREQVSLISEMGLELCSDLYFLGEKEPNKALEPTRTAVTSHACACAAPAARVAHL